jgi:hypothetical protein
MNIWNFQSQLTGRLIGINIANFLAGQRLQKFDGFWRGVGTQAVGWAVINIGIGVVGSIGTSRRLDKLDDPNTAEVQQEETRKLRRILAINRPLNYLYMLGGFLLARRNQDDAFLRGNGWGIILQGFILLLFDSHHLKRVKELEAEQET